MRPAEVDELPPGELALLTEYVLIELKERDRE